MLLDTDDVVSQKVFSLLVGISAGRVSQLVSGGVLPPGESLGGWLLAYTSHLREHAAGRAAAGDLDLATERARLAKEQADRVALQNATTRAELAPVAMMTEVLAQAGARTAAILEAIPGQVRRRLPSLPASEIDAIRQEIAKARNLCAAIRLQDLDEPADDRA